MRLTVLLATVAGLTAAAGAAASTPVPSSAAAAIRSAAGPSAFLPASVPGGYRYASWKNESPNGIPPPDDSWFVVTFTHGSSRLLWTVLTLSPAADEDRCNALSAGHGSVGGESIYWSAPTTYEPLGSGPKGRHVWRCLNSPGGGNRIKLDAFDQGGTLPIPTLTRLVARARNK